MSIEDNTSIIDINAAARALGRLGGKATKGLRTKVKKETSARNARKARKALAKKRQLEKILQVSENNPNLVLDSAV